MTGALKKSVLAAALAATALTSASPAMADPYGRHRRHAGGDAVGAAVLGGIIGLAIGVIAASATRKNERCENYPDQDRYRGAAHRDERCDRRQDGGYRDYPQQDDTYRSGGEAYPDGDGDFGYGEADRNYDDSEIHQDN